MQVGVTSLYIVKKKKNNPPHNSLSMLTGVSHLLIPCALMLGKHSTCHSMVSTYLVTSRLLWIETSESLPVWRWMNDKVWITFCCAFWFFRLFSVCLLHKFYSFRHFNTENCKENSDRLIFHFLTPKLQLSSTYCGKHRNQIFIKWSDFKGDIGKCLWTTTSLLSEVRYLNT